MLVLDKFVVGKHLCKLLFLCFEIIKMAPSLDIAKLVRFAKSMLIISNVLSCTFGILITGLGSWIFADFAGFLRTFFGNEDAIGGNDEVGGNYSTNSKTVKLFAAQETDSLETANQSLDLVSSNLIIVGVMIILQNILGCVGACNELKRLLVPYLIAVVVIILVEIVGLVLSITEWNKLLESIGTLFKLRLTLYGQDEEVTKAWDTHMNNWQCCGAYNATDFIDIAQMNGSETLPKYCCTNLLTDCTVDQALKGSMPGCIQRFLESPQNVFRVDIVVLSLEIGLKVLGSISTAVILKHAFEGNKEFWEWRERANTGDIDHKMQGKNSIF